MKFFTTGVFRCWDRPKARGEVSVDVYPRNASAAGDWARIHVFTEYFLLVGGGEVGEVAVDVDKREEDEDSPLEDVIQSALRPLRCRSFEDPVEELDRVGLSRMHFAADQYRTLAPQFLQTAVADLYFTPCVLDSVNTAN